MSDHLTAGERDVLTALTRAGLQGGHVTLDTLLVRNRMLLFSFSRASLARTLGALQRRCLTSKITTGGKAAYRIMPEGERVLAGKQQPAQAADAWAGQRFGTPAGEITVPCQMLELREDERVCTIYDVPGSSPILAIGLTTLGHLLYGVRAGKGWAFEPQWVGRIGVAPSMIQDVLEQISAEQHVIDRQRYPSELRQRLRKQLRLQSVATLRGLEAVFREVERRTLIGELARMRDDGEVRFQGARYVWAGKANQVAD